MTLRANTELEIGVGRKLHVTCNKYIFEKILRAVNLRDIALVEFKLGS